MDRDDIHHSYETAYPDRYEILKANARSNRTYQTDAEQLLWELVRRKALGYKFRRQQAIGDYIADFVCFDKKLIIEVDGEYHNTEQQRIEDNIRTDFLNKHGFYVLRFTNNMVIHDIEYVRERIVELLYKL